MKIAVSGAHRTGKTTLIGELCDVLPTFSSVEEPYFQLVEEGHSFSEMPGFDDFNLQLERSIRSVAESEENCIFDRCPCDIAAYLIAYEDPVGFDTDFWLPRIRQVVQKIDLVCFVPIESPDRIPSGQYDSLRRLVDNELRAIILEDCFDLGLPAIEVAGSPKERCRQILAALDGYDEVADRY